MPAVSKIGDRMLLSAVCLCLALRPEIDLSLAKTYFAEAHEASDRDGGKMWGKSISGPILFVDAKTKKCVTNEADNELKLTAQDGVWTGQLPTDTTVANMSFHYGGKSYAMVMWPLPTDKPLRVSLMIHESWHRIQVSLGLPANSTLGNHFSETDARIWFRLEMRALAAALKGDEDAAKTAIGDAVLFRRMRNAEFSGAEEAETALERHEGMAQYTGDRIGFTDDTALADHLIAELKDFEKQESMGRSFPYKTGPVYGVLLDRFRPAWRNDLMSSKGPAQLLAEALSLDWVGTPDGSSEAEVAYNGAEVRKDESDRAAERAKHLQDLKLLLVEGPVLDVTLTKPRMSFDPGTVFSLGPDGEAYGVMKVIDEWGSVEVQSGAGLLTNWQRLRVGLPDGFDEKTRTGKGWTLELKPGWHLAPGSRKGDWTVTKA